MGLYIRNGESVSKLGGLYSEVYGMCCTRSLRSNSQELLIQPAMAKTKSYGDRAFTVCAPELWNKVPLTIRNACTVTSFKKQLKTCLFSKFVDNNSLIYS